MTVKEELLQFMNEHENDPHVLHGLLDMASRAVAGESMESIAASYGVDLDQISERTVQI